MSILGYVLFVSFVWGLIAFAVAIDASRRGYHSALWAILTLFTGVFGGIAYGLVVIVTDDPSDTVPSEAATETEMVRICPACSSDSAGSQSYCSECGTQLGPEDERPIGRKLETGSRRFCSNCKSEIAREATTCPSCDAIF